MDTVFKNVAPYYVTQQRDDTCSVATALMIMNTLWVRQVKLATILTEADLVKAVGWAEAVNRGGPNVMHFATLLTDTLDALGLVGEVVEASAWSGTGLMEKSFRDWLVRLSQLDDNDPLLFISVDFKPSIVFPDIVHDDTYGHWVLIVDYNPDTDMVFIFDPDPDFSPPYWIDVALLVKGMKTRTATPPSTYRGFVVLDEI